MTNEEAINNLKNGSLSDSEVEAERFNKAYNMAIKALETVQRIDDVLDAKGMSETDTIYEVVQAMDEFRYDCGVDE